MNSCQQFHQFLNQFDSHAARIQVGHAYKIKQGDVVDYIANNVAELITPKGRLEFTHEQSVSLGDYIFLGSLGSSYHVSQSMFKRLFCDSAESIALPGQPVVQESYAGAPFVLAKVIRIKNRFFSRLQNGKVITSPYVCYGRQFERHNEKHKQELAELMAELKQRKKKPVVVEVGFWSRDIPASQGGVL